MRAIVISFVAHVTLIAVLIPISVFAPEILPVPPRALAYFEPPRMMTVDVELPSSRPQTSRAHGASRIAAQPETAASAAPLVAPNGVAAETGREGLSSSSTDVALSTIERGGGDVAGIGIPEAPTPPAPRTPVRLHSGIQPPRKIVDVAPAYPDVARIARVRGVVVVEATLDEHGVVASAHVLRSVAALDQAALEAVKRWRFTPALLNGEPVPVVITVTVNFTLQ
jgi:protein TonB